MKNQSHYSLRQLRKQPEFILTQLQNELYRALTAYMEQHGLSKKDMAAKLGVSPSYVSQILNGHFNFTVMKWVELALAIDKVPVIRLEDPIRSTRRVSAR